MERRLVVEMIFGSHLYGTDTPESDRDYKGVLLPDMDEVLLGRIPNALTESKGSDDIKNTVDDVDREWYSLHYFVKLGMKGETVILDMLHAPEEMILRSSPVWNQLVENRSRLYTKSLKALMGYARRQAAKYGVKGSRLNAMKSVLDVVHGGKNNPSRYRPVIKWLV